MEIFIDITVNLEACALFKRRGCRKFWINENNVAEYPVLSGEAEPFLLAFPSLYMVQAGFIHANVVLTKQRNIMNLEERGDLRLKITNPQPNILVFFESYQARF